MTGLAFIARAGLAAGLFLLAACQGAAGEHEGPDGAAREALDDILVLVEERLAVAPVVARSKWNSGAAIDAPAREAQILDGVSARAAEAGVSEPFARDFFQAQFEASKIVQTALHEAWRAENRPAFAESPDLASEVRPVLDRLTPALIEALREVEEIAPDPAAARHLKRRAEGLSPEDPQDEITPQARQTALQPILDRLAR